MKRTYNEIINNLSPTELRAINDLLFLINIHFLNIDPTTSSKDYDNGFNRYFSEIDFSRMSKPLSSIEAVNAIRNLSPDIKRFVFAKIMNATQHLIFWKTEREIILYLLQINFIGAKEVMMLNCSYTLRDLLPYNGCHYEFSSDDFFDFEMKIKNEDNFHCYIYLNTGTEDHGGFVKIFIDYDTVKHIRPYLYSPEGSINFIANQIDEKNYFKNHGNYTFSYTKKAAFGDAIRNGVWLSFHDIQLK